MVCPTIIFDTIAFRTMYPAFADATAYPDATLTMYWDMAGSYVANQNYGWLRKIHRTLALNLMTAHLLGISALIALGQNPMINTGASIDAVSVSIMPPPVQSQWKYWLSTTPYGAQLLALLAGIAVGGWGVGGSPTRSGFRGNGFW